MGTEVYYSVDKGWTTKEPERWDYAYNIPDNPENFISHMEKYFSIPAGPYDRETYEKVCTEFEVEPIADGDFHPYGMEYGNFGMAHYHVNPENRHSGISNTIHQQRFFGIQKEKSTEEIKKPVTVMNYEKKGQLWEPCEHCGNQPVYMPLHLCDNCWPGKIPHYET